MRLGGPISHNLSRAAKQGGFKRGRFPIWPCPSFFVLFFVLFGTFPISPGFSRFARGWSGDFPDSSLFLFLGLLTAPTRNSPERVRDTIWTFPEKSGKPPGLETPRSSFSQSLFSRKASAEIRREFSGRILIGILPWIFGGYFWAFLLIRTGGKIHPKIHRKIQIRIWELRGQNPHCKNLPLTCFSMERSLFREPACESGFCLEWFAGTTPALHSKFTCDW